MLLYWSNTSNKYTGSKPINDDNKRTSGIVRTHQYGYDNNYYQDDNRYGYDGNGYGYDDNGYGYDNGYSEKNIKPNIFPANKVSELGDEWWQWVVSINTATDPDPFSNEEQAGCDIGLQDNGKLFLVGTFKDVTKFPPTGFPVHECKIKEGTSILFPIVNTECSNIEDPPFFGATEDDRRECANDFIDEASDLQVNIDGIDVQHLEKYRIDSPAGGFEFNPVVNNPVDIPSDRGVGKSVSDGYWILLKDLKPGKHTITFSSAIDFNPFPPLEGIAEFGATYNLFVKSGYY